ncbi:MAG: 4-(cytidine 5'-diphospho)-2-C-methyl-D-erythritol kinase [Pseudomonadota bacterium]
MIDCRRDAPGWIMAGCKLNLFLHINGRRPDGFHELQTYFQLLEYGDELRVEANDSGEIRIRWEVGDEAISGRPERPEDDLLYRAATLLREAGVQAGHLPDSRPPGADVVLRKNVPVGGGLGGGSASAACLLNRLDRLWGIDFQPEDLEALATRLGADIPVFIRARSAIAHGIGERLTPIAISGAPEFFLILVPGIQAVTAGLYADDQLERDTPKMDDDRLLRGWREARNAFEPLIMSRSPALVELRDDLERLAGFARMTGSGSCLFAPVDSRHAGIRIGEELAGRHPTLRRFFVSSTA